MGVIIGSNPSVSNLHFGEGPRDISIQDAMNTTFNLGNVSRYVGKQERVNIRELDDLGAKRHYIYGDGSCWSRALWQCVFYQIFNSEEEFKRFIDKVANPENGYSIPSDLSKKTIHILYQLKKKNLEQKVEYLNHSAVDDTLVFYMRHVAAEYMRQNFSFASPQDIHDIKINKNRYGGSEIDAFMRYFHLDTHTITRNDQGKWLYRHRDKNLKTNDLFISDLVNQSIKLPHTCIFGVNDAHFEAISFNTNSNGNMAILTPKVIQKLDDLQKQIEENYEFALKVQIEDIKRFEEEQQSFYYAQQLQRQLNQELGQQQIVGGASSNSPKNDTSVRTTQEFLEPKVQDVNQGQAKTIEKPSQLKNEKLVGRKMGFFSKFSSFISSSFKAIGSFIIGIFTSFWGWIFSPFQKKKV